jgi:hypothetical protein
MSDAGMTSAYRPSQHTKPGLAGFFSKIGQVFSRAFFRPDPRNTSEQGASGTVSPSSTAFQLYSLRYERRAIITDCNEMYRNDPRCQRSINKFAREAIRSGCTINVNKPETKTAKATGDATSKSLTGKYQTAKEIADRIQAIVNPKLDSWAKMALVEGELFIQAVAFNDEIVNAKRMPAASMERLTDDADEFINVAQAFEQVDTMTEESVAKFPLALLYHARWNHVDGERYGMPEIASGRRIRRLLELQEEAQVRRRIARAPIARLWTIGDKDGKSSVDETQIKNFKAENGFVEGQRDSLDPQEIGRDYFGNGFVDAKVLEGDAHVHEVADMRYMQNIYASSALPTPPALYNLDAEAINRDVLEDQRAEFLKETKALTELMEGIVQWLFDLGLLLAGILPESIDATITFSESSIETPGDILDRAIKARQVTIGAGKNAKPDPLISRRTAVQFIAQLFNIDDIDTAMADLEAEDSERETEEDEEDEETTPKVPPHLPPVQTGRYFTPETLRSTALALTNARNGKH